MKTHIKNLFLLPALIAGLGLILAGRATAQSWLTNGLVAYYPLNGNVNDVWGGLNGQAVGPLAPTTNICGLADKAYRFVGNGFVNVPDATALHLQEMTIAFWVLLDPASGVTDLVDKDDHFRGFQFFTVPNGPMKVYFSVGDGSWHTTAGNGAITLGHWHLLVGTFDLQAIRLFLDGTNTDSVPYSGGVHYSTNSLQIARNGDVHRQYLSGNLSDIRLYSRALSSDEVANLYAYGSSCCPCVPQLTIIRSGANVILTWPTNAAGFTLQCTTNLVSPAVWSTVSPGPIVVNGRNAVTNPVSGTQKFYRLSQ